MQIFALDAQTIGVSNSPPAFWSEQCLWQGTIQGVVEENGDTTIMLPQMLVSFYQPRKIDLSVDAKKTRILLVINGD